MVEVRRRTKGRTVEERREEDSRKVCRTVQIFVKVDGRKRVSVGVATEGQRR